MSTAQNSTMPPIYNDSDRSLKGIFPPHLLKKAVAEMVSTFLLVFVTCGSGAISGSDPKRISQLGQSVASGLIITVMIYAVGHISGAHMNPAVTLAFAVFRHFPWIQVPFYWVAQFTGAISASFVLKAVLHPITVIGTTTPTGPYWQSLLIEVIVTFNMMFVGELAGLAIGSAVCITSIFAGPVSGGSMNPARTLGPAFASNLYTGLWIYFVGPILGTISGALTYTYIRIEDTTSNKDAPPQKLSSFKLRRLQSQYVAAELDHIQAGATTPHVFCMVPMHQDN
nr:unnamed protein product [Digitaria exilis]